MQTDAHEIALKFEQALQALEVENDDARIVAMFSEDAHLGNLGSAQDLRGRDGAKDFWNRYREQFSEIRSEFSQTVAVDSTAVMEWESKGSLRDGRPIKYRGVSILRLDDQGQVFEFQTYYDSAAFIAPRPTGTSPA